MQPQQEDSSDITLLLKDSKEIRAPRSQLSESDFFSTLLNSDMKENREGIIRLEHITDTVMTDVLEFMRCGCVMITQPGDLLCFGLCSRHGLNFSSF